MKFDLPSVSFTVSISSIAEWLISEVPSGGEIGFDPFLFSVGKFLFSSPVYHQ